MSIQSASGTESQRGTPSYRESSVAPRPERTCQSSVTEQVCHRLVFDRAGVERVETEWAAFPFLRGLAGDIRLRHEAH